MGDRANVEIRDTDGSVFLYTHNGGYSLPRSVQDGLRIGRDRWADGSYLARIVFNAMGADAPGTTGFGISAAPAFDRNWPLLTLDIAAQEVRVEETNRPCALAVHSFAEFASPNFVAHW